MNIKEIMSIVKAKDERRFPHVYGTYEMATKLAEQYGENIEKAQIAALFHDYAKNEPLERMIEVLKIHAPAYLPYSKNVYHGPVGRYLIEEEFDIHDEQILNAVEYHVTGHPDMDNLAKIIFISDYIELGRTHQPAEFARYLSQISLDLSLLYICEATIKYLEQVVGETRIHPYLYETYQKYLEEVGETEYESIKNHYQRYR